MDAALNTTRAIDQAYLNALRLGPQRIGHPGIPIPVAHRLVATGDVRLTNGECYAKDPRRSLYAPAPVQERNL